MRKVIITIVILIIFGLIGLQLYLNKKTIHKNAEISSIQISKFPVTASEVKKTILNQSFIVNGTFEASNDLNFVSEVQGRITKLFIQDGDYIRESQIMIQLESELLSNQLHLAEANYEKAVADLNRYEIIAKGDAVTEKQLEDIKIAHKTAKTNFELARKNFRDTQIKAPVSGIINKVFIEKGSYLMPGTPIAQIIDVSRLKMCVNISEKRVLQIHKNQKVIIVADLFPKNNIEGFIKSISVQADNSKNYAVEIEFKNSGKQDLKAGMNGSVIFNVAERSEILAIPRKCIIGNLQSPKVFVISNDSISHLKNIQIGKEINDTLEVLTGLKVGERVFSSGQSNLQEGTVISIINK